MKNCFILGSGRSGTSMLAGTLSGAGYYMGNDMMPATEGNPRGYFEAFDIEAINEDILSLIVPQRPSGFISTFFRNRPGRSQRWLSTVPVESKIISKPEIDNEIRNKVINASYCFKDPRFCYTLPVWLPHVDINNTVFCCIFRDPTVTVRSILKEINREHYLRDLIVTKKHLFQVWYLMYSHILQGHSKKGDWLFLHYSQLFDTNMKVRIERFIEAEIDRDFPDMLLNRSQGSDKLPKKLDRVYQELCARSGYSS